MMADIGQKLSFLDHYLTMWIFAAMILGVGVDYLIPGLKSFINAFQVGTTNIPIAVRLARKAQPDVAKFSRGGECSDVEA